LGRTSLHVAAFDGKETSTRWLLKKGADANAKNNESQTPLQVAALKGQTAVMTNLILGAAPS